MVQVTNFKIGMRAPKESADMTREKIEKVAWSVSRDSGKFFGD